MYSKDRLTKDYKPALESNLFTGAVLMNMSKAFDCVLRDLPVAKFYGLKLETETFLTAT